MRIIGSLLDQLDPVLVRVAHEADPRAALAHLVGRALGLDPDARELLERGVQVVDGQGDVAVARADVVRAVLVFVPGQLQAVAVAGQAHEDVDRLVADRQPPAFLEAQLLVERDRPVDVRDPVAGVDQLAHGRT